MGVKSKICTAKLRLQCAKCPWKKSTDPHAIPNGYSAELHQSLKDTIAEEGRFTPSLRIFACHETKIGAEIPCVGWIANQAGPGNNLALRYAILNGRIDGNVKTVGPQHETFEDTLPALRDLGGTP